MIEFPIGSHMNQFKAKDHKNAEEWFQCLQIAVAQAHRDADGLEEEISKI